LPDEFVVENIIIDKYHFTLRPITLPYSLTFSLNYFVVNSYLAIFIGGLIPMLLGFIWYHPKIFGGPWMKSLGFTEESLKQGNMGLTMGLALVISMAMSWLNNAYASHTEPGMSQFVHGFYHGAFYMGVPGALVLASNSLFQRNSLTNILINVVYWIVALGLMGSFLYSVAAPEVAPVG